MMLRAVDDPPSASVFSSMPVTSAQRHVRRPHRTDVQMPSASITVYLRRFVSTLSAPRAAAHRPATMRLCVSRPEPALPENTTRQTPAARKRNPKTCCLARRVLFTSKVTG
jgi:hypothetical protein